MEGLGAEATSRPHTQDAAVCNGPAQASNSTTAAQALGGARTAEATCSEASLTTPRTATAAATPSVAIAARRQRVSIKSPRPTTTSLTAEPGGSLAAEGRTAHSGRDLPGRQRASPTRGPTCFSPHCPTHPPTTPLSLHHENAVPRPNNTPQAPSEPHLRQGLAPHTL